MISFDEALSRALGAARPPPFERTGLARALGRVLAEEVHADMDLPPFDRAIVDGYACRRANLPGPLRIVLTIAAGRPPTASIGPGECAKIMTGAMIPTGADCVFMVEQSEAAGADTVRHTGAATNDNIARRASDVKSGQRLLEPGMLIGPPEIAVLASMGIPEPLVAQRPRVTIIATGDELVEPGERLSLSQIRNSNGYQLIAQAAAMGLDPIYGGIARDTDHDLDTVLGRAFARSDVVLLSGGVSMGDFDLVPAALKRQGVEILFDKIAIQPGKPTVFGRSHSAYCFGLPGNPISTFCIFELLVKPFLYKLMGHDHLPPTIVAPLAEPFRRKSPARKAWVPIALRADGTAARVDYHGSGHVNALAGADGLIAFPEGVAEMAAGTPVAVRLIRH